MKIRTENLQGGVSIHYLRGSTVGTYNGKPYPEIEGTTIEIEIKGAFFGQIPLRGIPMSQIENNPALLTAIQALIRNWLYARGIKF